MSTTIIPDKDRRVLIPAGELLRAKRQALGLSSAAVGKKIGKSSGYVSNVETAVLRMSDEAADRLEELYELETNSLPRLGLKPGRRIARKGSTVKKDPALRASTTSRKSNKREPAPALVPTVDRAQLITVLMRIHRELVDNGVEDLSIKARHGDQEIEVTSDSFTVRRA